MTSPNYAADSDSDSDVSAIDFNENYTKKYFDNKTDKLIKHFTSKIKRMVLLFRKKMPDDVQIERVQNNISVIAQIHPILPLENVGPYLYQYRKEIKDKEYDKCINQNYDEYINATTSFKREEMSYLIECVRKIANILTEEEMDAVHDVLIDLLSYYCVYIAMDKYKEKHNISEY